jgi:Na+-transporting methylmalonyl-CoA/oxaloacetate decarboxylase gamma subunit
MLDFILMNKAIFIVFGTLAVLAAFMFILTEWSRREAKKNEKDKSIENPEKEVSVK